MDFYAVQHILSLEKRIVDGDKLLDHDVISCAYPSKVRKHLKSVGDESYSFILDINNSNKNKLKLTLHMQNKDDAYGIIRLDYGASGHVNPVEVNASVPKIFIPYAGKPVSGNHIHYYIPGYKSLSWAIPLEIDTFAVKKYTYSNISDIVTEFFRKINLTTSISFLNTLGL